MNIIFTMRLSISPNDYFLMLFIIIDVLKYIHIAVKISVESSKNIDYTVLGHLIGNIVISQSVSSFLVRLLINET